MIWTAAHTKPNLEGRAERNLQRKQFVTFLPRYIDRSSGRKCLLFPRYIFIGLADNWFDVFHTVGIAHYFVCDGKPATVPTKEILNIQSLLGDDGLVRLGFHPNQKLRILRGQFNDMIAIYKGFNKLRNRDIVEVTMFGALREIELPVGQLAAE